jgi:hypothetical protein
MCASLCAKLYTKNGQSGMRENPALLEMKKKPLQMLQWLEEQLKSEI